MELSVKMLLIRKKLGLNQTDFGNSLGLEQGSYAAIEGGRTKKLSKSVLILLELIYKINIKWLKSDSEDFSNMFIKVDNNEIVSDYTVRYIKCEECIEKDKRIAELEEIINTINKLTSKK